MADLSPAELERNAMAARTHGAQVAPIRLAPRAAEIATYLRSIVPIAEEADEPTIALLSLVFARIERANAYIDQHGLFDESGNPQGVLKVLSGFENTAARLCSALGLSPVSRASLGLDLVRARAVAQGTWDLSTLTDRELAAYRQLAAKVEKATKDVSVD